MLRFHQATPDLHLDIVFLYMLEEFLKLMSQSEQTQNFITSSHQATPDLHVKICLTQYVEQPKK